MKESLILPNKVLVREDKPQEKKTVSGIIMPETRKSPTQCGEIILVGSACDTAKVGMKALYTPLSATRFVINDSEEVAILPETSILFLFRE